MRKKNLFICLFFTFLMCITLNFSFAKEKAFAEESSTITITFSADGGTCATSSIDITSGQSIGTLPEASRYKNEIFIGWFNESAPVDETTTFTQTTTLTAGYARKLLNYTISNNEDKLKIVEQTSNSSYPYTLTETCESLESAISLITADIESCYDNKTVSSISETIYINFENISLSQDLSLSFNKIEITGTLNINNYSVLFTPTSTSSTINLTDIEFVSTSNQNFIEILGTNNSTITTSNVKFTASQNDNNYSIKLENPIHTLYFTNTLSYSSTYLYNYELADGNPDLQRKASFESNFILESPSTIAITIPFNVDGQSILSSRVGDATLFTVYPNQSNFTCSVKDKIGTALNVTTSFNISFDPNGGTIEEAFTVTNTRFNPTTQLDFPTKNNYTKTHFDLSSFVAKFSYNGNTWYFDKTALQNFYNDQTETDISTKLSTHFYTSIPNTTLDGFSYYKYDKTGTDLNFLATSLILELETTPTFVAIWTDTEYEIILNKKDGTETTSLTGIYGSTVTLPTPTRTGFNFVGWFANETDAEEADSTKKLTITSMPDNNPTIYAGWSVITHTLSIQKNNQTSIISLPVNFGTVISSLSELDSQTISKKGYTFVGWFTDEALSTELDESATMPDSDFAVYAKWTINQYTITLYYNHPSVDSDAIFKTTTQNYNSDVRSLFSTNPSFEGYTFNRWCTDPNGRYPASTLPQTMPDSNLTLYAHFTPNEYTLTVIHLVSGENGQVLFSDSSALYFNSPIQLSQPTYTGLLFGGWFTNETLTESLTSTSMPSKNLTVYAKFTEKQTLNLEFEPQSYTISANGIYRLPENLEGFVVEYFVDESWTTTAPTKKGSYDVRISKAENNTHKAFITTIEDGFVITAKNADLSIWILIFYCLAGVELICSIIVLFLRKQRKTYLAYAITLPIGIVSNSQFINFVISLILAVFGFILFVIQIVKLKEVNRQIAKMSTENSGYTPPDISENKSISKNVEILLEKEGFISSTKEPEVDKNSENDDEISNDNDEFNQEDTNENSTSTDDEDDDSLKF